MEQLWAPWRMKYVNNQEHSGTCVFCDATRHEDGLENLVVYRKQYAFVILNRFPYTSGHLMVVPFAHQSSIEELEAATRGEMMELINQAMQVLRAEYHPEAFNLGANIGAAAGAGIAEHVHFHVVPRWAGDTNFMSAVGDTRVIPEELSESYRRIVERWKSMG
jgi:ATP adenylyltransferase